MVHHAGSPGKILDFNDRSTVVLAGGDQEIVDELNVSSDSVRGCMAWRLSCDSHDSRAHLVPDAAPGFKFAR